MPVYVTLGRYTAEAMKNIHEVSERLQQNTQLIEASGRSRLRACSIPCSPYIPSIPGWRIT